jgi:tripartite-type tricarboxylate transporter receptor subunit TctC
MDSNKRTFTQALAGAALLAAAPRIATAQPAWPTRPVRLVIPFGVGGGSDVAARLLAQELSTRWGQQVIVENKPGADTSIAASEVQRAAPDGYTLLMTINSTLTLTPHTMKVAYDPMGDFTYVGQLTDVPLVVMVPDALPVKTFGEFVEYARARPGQINAGGAATLTQLLAEQLSRETGAKLTWIMYKSGAEITRALLSNEVHLGADAPAQNLPHIQAGKIRALAATGSARMSMLPDVPTFRELGIRAPLVTLQHYLLAPRGLPPALLTRMQQDVQAVLASAAVREKLAGFGFQARWLDGAEAFKNVQAQHATTADLVRQAGLKPQ